MKSMIWIIITVKILSYAVTMNFRRELNLVEYVHPLGTMEQRDSYVRPTFYSSVIEEIPVQTYIDKRNDVFRPDVSFDLDNLKLKQFPFTEDVAVATPTNSKEMNKNLYLYAQSQNNANDRLKPNYVRFPNKNQTFISSRNFTKLKKPSDDVDDLMKNPKLLDSNSIKLIFDKLIKDTKKIERKNTQSNIRMKKYIRESKLFLESLKEEITENNFEVPLQIDKSTEMNFEKSMNNEYIVDNKLFDAQEIISLGNLIISETNKEDNYINNNN